MPLFTVETTYRLPVYRHRAYPAATFEAACRLALKDDDCNPERPDYESSGPTHVTGGWRGERAYVGKALAIPAQFEDGLQRQAAHFPILLELLDEAAQPMGITATDFARWLPRATAAVAKAEAILAGAPDPESLALIAGCGDADVRRNPILGLPAMAALRGLDSAARSALAAILGDLVVTARAQAEASWARNKGIMAAYWKTVAVYAGHIRRALRRA